MFAKGPTSINFVKYLMPMISYLCCPGDIRKKTQDIHSPLRE